MAYQGYLLKFGSADFPHKYLAQDPVITPCQRLDVQAYRDANGDLHRVTVNYKTKIEFTTISGLDLSQKVELAAAMNAGLLNSMERKFEITYWNDDFTIGTDYRTGVFYLSDVSYSPKFLRDGTIIYGAVTYTFVEY